MGNSNEKNKTNKNTNTNNSSIQHNNLIDKKYLKERINNYELKIIKDEERCITSFAILRNNKILLTLKGGIIKIYKFIHPGGGNTNKIELIELIRIEEEEYCFNYGIELKNGDLAVCSEDSTIKIIKIIFNNIDNNLEENNIIKDNNESKYLIIQKINLVHEPLYIIKEFSNGELIIGGWEYILFFVKVPSINKYELINKIFIKDRTFSLIELSIGEIISSQCYSKTLTIYNLNTYEINIIQNVESNENPNIICKYNSRNDIVFVAYNKGVNIISIINKSIIANIKTYEMITCLCPFITHLNYNKNIIFCLLCGIKKKVYNQNVNYNYNFVQLGFNNINSNNKNQKIEIIIYEEKNKVHFHEIRAIENILFSNNNILNINKEEQLIISMGNEDKKLKIWETKKSK